MSSVYAEGNDYDRGVNTFSPAGRLFQVEYAGQAIKLGATVIAINTSEGVVIGAEKRIKQKKLLVGSSIKKVVEISKVHLAGVSGLTADGNILLDHGRVEAQNHQFTYNENMPTKSLVRRMCDYAMNFGAEKSLMSRPFGVAMLIAGLESVDEGKNLVPVLYHLDPSGTFVEYRAKAIGAGEETAMDALVEQTHKSQTLSEATSTVLNILTSVMEEKATKDNVDLWTLERVENMDGSLSGQIRNIKGEEFDSLLKAVSASQS